LTAKGQVPPDGGKIVRVEWDFDGSGEFAERKDLGAPSTSANVSVKHTYAKPGTYFAVVRVTARRGGDATTPYQQIQNLARIRVVVK
jgi:PKD repeat protein